MHSPGKVVAREELAEEVLGRKFSPLDRSLDMHLSRLRKKLAEGSPHEDRVKTIRGVGYQLTIHRNQAEAKD
jgi:two-component system response regulator CpxR